MAQLDANGTICECVARTDRLNRLCYFFSIAFRDKLLPELDGV